MTKIIWNSSDINTSFLMNNDLIIDSNKNTYVLERKNGYILNLLHLKIDSISKKYFVNDIKSVNIDIYSPEYDRENEYFTHAINGYSTLNELINNKE